MATEVETEAIDALLAAVASGLRAKDAAFLQKVLTVDTDVLDKPPYTTLRKELRKYYAWEQRDKDDKDLEEYCEKKIPIDPGWTPDSGYGQAWPALIIFVKQYLIYVRDHTTLPVAEHHEYVYILLEHALTALSHSTLGVLVLDTCMLYGRYLKTLSVHLDSPEWRKLCYQVRSQQVKNKKRFYSLHQKPGERAAELFQRALGICLTDRTGGGGPANRFAKVEGKRTAIYYFANLAAKCLKACNQLSTCTQMYTNIHQMAPPLAAYPAAHRVDYLYHLGRFYAFLESNYRASLCLEEAYHQCAARFLGHRRKILRFLVCLNITMGRFPSQKLFARPEASSFHLAYVPLCRAIRQGDFRSLRKWTGPRYKESSEVSTLAKNFRAYFAGIGTIWLLKMHCELLTWRCLVRKTFLIAGFHGDGKKAPTMSLDDLRIVAEFLDPALVWPLGNKPWCQDIDGHQWVEEKRKEWELEIQNWEVDSDPEVERWPWEPDIKGPRLRRKLPPGELQPEYTRPAKNEAARKEWFKEEEHRMRMLIRYYQMFQMYWKHKPPQQEAKLAWWRNHNLPGAPVRFESPQIMIDWFRRSVKIEQRGQTPWFNPAKAAKRKAKEAAKKAREALGIKDDEDDDPAALPTKSYDYSSDEEHDLPILTPEILAEIPKGDNTYMKDPTIDQVLLRHWGDDWSKERIRSSRRDSFDSIQAARGLWTGGTWCQRKPALYPRDIPDRDYAPPRPVTPPRPLDTDLFIFDQLSCLISQGLLHGFLSWKLKKFGITGAKQHGALEAGFPTVWPMLKKKMEDQDVADGNKPGYVPGWVREEFEKASQAAVRTGGVIRLSGARAVGE